MLADFLAIVALIFYPITAKRVVEIRRILEERRGIPVSPICSTWILAVLCLSLSVLLRRVWVSGYINGARIKVIVFRKMTG